MNIRLLTTVSIIISSLIIYVEAKYGSYNTSITGSSRIVGGNLASAGQFPYVAFYRWKNAFRCGGAIINSRYILTAAHCVFINGSRIPANALSVGVGTNDNRDTSIAMNPVEEVKVHKWYKQPEFDIALLLLATTLEFNAFVQPVSVATYTVPTGTMLTVAGWGATYTGSGGSTMLRHVRLATKSTAECFPPPRQDIPSVLCCGSPEGQGVCFGDSGSPAVYDGRVLGIMSHIRSTQCGTINFDGAASVPYTHRWINNNSVV